MPDAPVRVEVTGDGYVRLDAELAAARFPGDSLVALPRGRELWLVPLVGPQGGGVLLKQRNLRGDRAALVREALADDHMTGIRPATWDEDEGALRVELDGREVGR
ncbi:MAG: hydrogenase maturation protease [Actinomycetota bacterium]|nr:hydrogenase maturation protease [Actinomycetota bacterium]